MQPCRRALLTALPGLLALGACGTVVPPPRAEGAPASLLDALAAGNAPNAPNAPNGGRLWRLDAGASRLRIVAFRGGTAARLGHHHLLEAGDAEGALWLPEQGLTGAQGELRTRLDALVLDDPRWRAEAGGEFNEKPLDADAIAATKRNLLSPQGLNAAAHPEVRLQLVQLTGAAPWWAATVAMTLAGRTQTYRVALAVAQGAQQLRLQGRLVLRHSEHGLAPFSILGGLLAVQDEVLLDADLRWR
ncbi:MAG: YceI family protein [Inhella sp.]|jgi:hypothetical protein|uniref:YceI family protein n=1 Tax=Inhella sp. TaxID=1921806 RepID=UPI0022BDD7F9|nr:YceI family protein [Inhella sp.]MCZ8235665.1 YceI family protein [Inhella sp.]